LLPALVLLAVFVVWPLGRAGVWSLTNANLLAPEKAAWVGGANYSDLLGDHRYRQAFANTALFALLVVPVQTLLAFGLALWVNRPERAWRWLRSVFFLPVIVSMPALAILWTILYQPAHGTEMGLVNAVGQVLGLQPQAWLRDPALALPAIAFMSVWQGVGLQMIAECLAGIAGRRARRGSQRFTTGSLCHRARPAQHDRLCLHRYRHSLFPVVCAALPDDPRGTGQPHAFGRAVGL